VAESGWLSILLPPEISPALALALVLLSFFTSLLSAAVGIGGGTVLLVAMVSFLPPLIVLPVHGLVQLGSNAGRAWLLRSYANRRILVWFAGGAVLGVIVAANVFVALPGTALEIIIAVFVLYAAWAPALKPTAIPWKGFALVGAGTTFATMFVGGTGTLVAAFLSPERLGREPLVATHASCMSVQHTLKVIAFGLIGFQFAHWAALMAAMIVTGFAGTVVGRRLLGRLPERTFAIVYRTAITLLAVRLLYRAVTG